MPKRQDAIVVGAGPNGLAAAITLARAGRSVVVFEAKDTIGGGSRSMELTLPGFVHDVCSAIHPLGLGSPFFRTLPLEQYGLEWIQPAAALAHPLDDGTAVMLERSIEATSETLGCDAKAYRKLMSIRCRLGYPRRRLFWPATTAFATPPLRSFAFRSESNSSSQNSRACPVQG